MPTQEKIFGRRSAGWQLLIGMAVWCELVACAAPEVQQQDAPEPLEDPITERIEEGELEIGLQILADEMTAPNWGTFAPGREGFLFVADQAGIVWSVDLQDGNKRVFLDVRKRLVRLDPKYDERGLLGLAFHPDFSNNGLLYTYTSEPVGGAVDFSTMPRGSHPDHHTVIAQWRVPDPASSSSLVDPDSAAELLRIEQPQANHNAGGLVFGPDRMLYIALGDGGGADDQGIGHAADGNGQDVGNILGAILRIDPSGTSGVNGRYGVPEDNPFAKDSRAVAEIYAYGFRCPFRMSFDPLTGRLLAGDVGQNDIEEIDLVQAGGNYGWRLREGTFEFHHNEAERGFVTPPVDQPALIDPIAQYDQDEGNSVIGGFVYRGNAIPELRDVYIFGDWQGHSKQGRLFYLTPPIADDRLNAIHEFRVVGRALSKLMLHGFGEDADGEIYVLANETGAPSGRTGVVLKVVPPPAPEN